MTDQPVETSNKVSLIKVAFTLKFLLKLLPLNQSNVSEAQYCGGASLKYYWISDKCDTPQPTCVPMYSLSAALTRVNLSGPVL